MDCYSPGQGLMPASFKVRTVFIDGDKAKGTEELLDPDFGEAAIDRVTLVDSDIVHVSEYFVDIMFSCRIIQIWTGTCVF